MNYSRYLTTGFTFTVVFTDVGTESMNGTVVGAKQKPSTNRHLLAKSVPNAILPNAGGPQPTREYALLRSRSRPSLQNMRAPCAHPTA